MKRHIIFLIAAIVGILPMVAANGKSLLVFRKSGDISVFHSDRIRSIELSRFDSDSIEHEDYVSQIFYTSDSSFTVIPIADIDSVAFGSRTIVETKTDIRRLTTDEAGAIISFGPDRISYGPGLTLSPPECVYYDAITETLPYGLLARITDVRKDGDIWEAQIEQLTPADVFEKYIIAGNPADDEAVNHNAPAYDEPVHIFELPATEVDGFQLSGKIEFVMGAHLQDVMLDFIHHKYHARLTLDVSAEMEFKVESEDSRSYEWCSDRYIRLCYPFFGGAIVLEPELHLFTDFEASLGVAYNSSFTNSYSIEWKRTDGQDTFSHLESTENPTAEFEQKVHAFLKGSLFIGPSVYMDLGLLWHAAGAGVCMNVGPKFEADFDMGSIIRLSENFENDAYAKAKIDISAGVQAETYYYTLGWGDYRERHQLPFTGDLFFPLRTINLLPEFHTRSVLSRENTGLVQTPSAREAVDISTYVEQPIPYPLDVDFEVCNKETGDSVASVDPGKLLEAELPEEKVQNIITGIVVPQEITLSEDAEFVVHPVINYRNHRIKAQPSKVLCDVALTPMIASLCGNGTFLISGMIPVSQRDFGSETYIEGNNVAILRVDPKLADGKKTVTTVYFNFEELDNDNISQHPLIGTWAGTIEGEEITLVFNDNKNGSFNGQPFTYSYNSPRQGGLAILLEDGSTITMYVISITAEQLDFHLRDSEDILSLRRV